MLRGVSVIICTYNGSKRLPKTLYHLAKQIVAIGLPWEVILVDNNSTDNTVEISKTEWASFASTTPFTVVSQAMQGLSYARQKGIETSIYNYIIFCDDDNFLDENYVQLTFDLFETKPEIGIIGGSSTGAYESHPPDWFKEYFGHYAIGGRKEAAYSKWVAGAGMGIRREVLTNLSQINFAPLLSGRKGNALTSGEDVELCYMAAFLGYKIFYSPALHFVHFMTEKRLSWQYTVKLITEGQAISQIFIDIYDLIIAHANEIQALSSEKAYKDLVKKTKSALFNQINSLRKLLKFIKNYILSTQGSKYEIKIKFELNRYLFAINHKKLLVASFKQAKNMYLQAIQLSNNAEISK